MTFAVDWALRSSQHLPFGRHLTSVAMFFPSVHMFYDILLDLRPLLSLRTSFDVCGTALFACL